MKKVLLAAALLAGVFTSSFAQTTTKENKQPTNKTTAMSKKGEQPKATAHSAAAKSDATRHMAKNSTSAKQSKSNKKG